MGAITGRVRIRRQFVHVEEPRDILSRYTRVPEAMGCRRTCLIHVVLLVLLLLVVLVWIIQNRLWNYTIEIKW